MDRIAAAAAYKRDNPAASYQELSNQFNVPKTTLHARLTGKHHSRQESARGRLSKEAEQVILNRINLFASLGSC